MVPQDVEQVSKVVHTKLGQKGDASMCRSSGHMAVRAQKALLTGLRGSMSCSSRGIVSSWTVCNVSQQLACAIIAWVAQLCTVADLQGPVSSAPLCAPAVAGDGAEHQRYCQRALAGIVVARRSWPMSPLHVVGASFRQEAAFSPEEVGRSKRGTLCCKRSLSMPNHR